jgi:hypothetical protein
MDRSDVEKLCKDEALEVVPQQPLDVATLVVALL